MFLIKSDKTIQLNKGDNVRTPLFINQGTKLNPVRFDFGGVANCSVTTNPLSLNAELDFIVWKEKVVPSVDSSNYKITTVFTYNGSAWQLNSTAINLADYGLEITDGQTLTSGNTITVEYSLYDKTQTEVYFYVWQHKQKTNQSPVLKKIIVPSTNIITTYRDGVLISTERKNTVNENGDILIRLNPIDTNGGTVTISGTTITVKDIPEGQYLYQISAKVWDKYSGEYVNNTLTNRLKFNVVEDDFSNRDWNTN